MTLASRFFEPIFVDLSQMSDEDRERHERKMAAFRLAIQGDYSLGIELGLFPPDGPEDVG